MAPSQDSVGPSLTEVDAILTAAYYRTQMMDDVDLIVYAGHPYYVRLSDDGLIAIAALTSLRTGIADDLVLQMLNEFNKRRCVVKWHYFGREDRTLVFETDINTESGLVPHQLVTRLLMFERILSSHDQLGEVLTAPL